MTVYNAFVTGEAPGSSNRYGIGCVITHKNNNPSEIFRRLQIDEGQITPSVAKIHAAVAALEQIRHYSKIIIHTDDFHLADEIGLFMPEHTLGKVRNKHALYKAYQNLFKAMRKHNQVTAALLEPANSPSAEFAKAVRLALKGSEMELHPVKSARATRTPEKRNLFSLLMRDPPDLALQ